ncbi:hypothetical protein YC2023_051950 [Brassica napus]
MKEDVAGGLIRRRPAGRPAKANIFRGTGLDRHFEDRSPRGTCPMWPARRLTRRGTGRNGIGKPKAFNEKGQLGRSNRIRSKAVCVVFCLRLLLVLRTNNSSLSPGAVLSFLSLSPSGNGDSVSPLRAQNSLTLSPSPSKSPHRDRKLCHGAL